MVVVNVLLVEDSFYAADLNIRQLEKVGFNVRYKIVKTRAAMTDYMREQSWDLIISDNLMPGFSALQALEVRNKLGKRIPFVIVSELISDDELDSASKSGCNGFVPKESLENLRLLASNLLKETG